MKKRILSLAIVSILSTPALASGLYLQGSAGYADSDNLDLDSNATSALMYTPSGNRSYVDDDNTVFGAAMGYMFDISPSFHMGVQVGYTTLSSQSVSSDYANTVSTLPTDKVILQKEKAFYKKEYNTVYNAQMSYKTLQFYKTKEGHKCMGAELLTPYCAINKARIQRESRKAARNRLKTTYNRLHPDQRSHLPYHIPVKYTQSQSVSTASIDSASMIDVLAVAKYDVSKRFSVGGGLGMAYVMSSVSASSSGSYACYNDKCQNGKKADKGAYGQDVSYDSKKWQPEAMVDVDFKIVGGLSVGGEFKHVFGDDVGTSDIYNQDNVNPEYNIYQVTVSYTF